MTHLIAIAGHMQAGKTTCMNYLYGHEMMRRDATGQFTFRISEKGELIVRSRLINSKTFKEEIEDGILDVTEKTPQFVQYAEAAIWPYVKAYNFADTLKDICIEVLGLEYEQCYGTNEQKNSETGYRWENMPGVTTETGHLICTQPDLDNFVRVAGIQLGEDINEEWTDEIAKRIGLIIHKPGPMTGREVLQFVGTEIFRKMNGDVWVDNCMRLIEREQPDIAIIADCRFPNEADAIKRAGGKVIRLTRSPFDDPHPSETALDDYEDFDAIIDNSNISMDETNKKFLTLLQEWGVTE